MTTEELIEWIADEKNDALVDKRQAEAEFNGNKLWYYEGMVEAFDRVLEKLQR